MSAMQAVAEKFERASKIQSQLDIWPYLQFAQRYKLRWVLNMLGGCLWVPA